MVESYDLITTYDYSECSTFCHGGLGQILS